MRNTVEHIAKLSCRSQHLEKENDFTLVADCISSSNHYIVHFPELVQIISCTLNEATTIHGQVPARAAFRWHPNR